MFITVLACFIFRNIISFGDIAMYIKNYEFCVWSLSCDVGLSASFVIILLKKRELAALLYFLYCGRLGISVLHFFLTVP